MKRVSSRFLVFTLVLSLLMTGCGGTSTSGTPASGASAPETSTPVNKDPIRIGHAVALTGDSSVFGQSEATGLKLAVEAINQRGGILGRQVEVIQADTRADPTEAVNAVRRLVDQEKVVAVIGVAQSGVAMAATPIITEAKIPMIATAASNPYVTIDKTTGELNEYVFRACFIDPYQGTVAAHYAFNELNIKTAAILYDVGNDYSQWLANYFEEAFVEAGGTITGKEAYRTGELDFRAPLGKIKETAPEVLFLPVNTKDAALICKQARDLNITCPFIGGDQWASPDILNLGKEAVEGSYYISFASFDDPVIKTWVEENESKFNGSIVHNALLAYDAMLWLEDAITRAGDTDGDKVVAALLSSKDVPVLTTDKYNVDPETHNPLNRSAYIMKIESSEFKYVTTYAPSSN